MESADQRAAHVLRAVYFCYLAAIGIAVTWWPLHLKALGLVGAEIGLLFTARTAVTVISQSTLPAFGDRIRRPIAILRIALLWGAIIPLTLLVTRVPLLVGIAICTSGMMTSSIIPMMDATIVRRVGTIGFGRVRLFGSLGYGLAVAGFGIAVAGVSHARAGWLAIPGFCIPMFLAAVISLMLRESPGDVEPRGETVEGRLRSLRFAGFCMMNALHWAAIMTFNIYLSLHTEALGMHPGVPGYAVAMAIGAEIVALYFARHLLDRFTAWHWLPIVYGVGILRWVVTGAADSVWLIVAVQVLHLLSFGVWLASIIELLSEFAPSEQRGRAQGLLGAVVFGVGGALGSSVSGWVLDAWSSAAVFYGAAVAECMALLVFVVMSQFRRREARQAAA